MSWIIFKSEDSYQWNKNSSTIVTTLHNFLFFFFFVHGQRQIPLPSPPDSMVFLREEEEDLMWSEIFGWLLTRHLASTGSLQVMTSKFLCLHSLGIQIHGLLKIPTLYLSSSLLCSSPLYVHLNLHNWKPLTFELLPLVLASSPSFHADPWPFEFLIISSFSSSSLLFFSRVRKLLQHACQAYTSGSHN